MADDNTIIEGTVKFRDGKKWKSRWCVMRKLSPVADCVHLQLYRDSKARYAGAGSKASLSLQHYLGCESGFTLDKHSNTLALVCRDVVAVLAFETRERLIQWQVKVSGELGEARQYLVLASGGGRLPAGPARLLLLRRRLAVTAGVPPRLLGVWDLHHLRRYGVVEGRFCFEGGSYCGKGEGLHVLITDQAKEIAVDFDLASQGRLSPKRRPPNSKKPTGAESPKSHKAYRPDTRLSDLNTVDRTLPPLDLRLYEDPCIGEEAGAISPYWPSTERTNFQDMGHGDTVSVNETIESTDIAPWNAAGNVSLERCMSCISKLGALSRSSTAALTPGAKHFNPAWTMDAVQESFSEPVQGVPSCDTLPSIINKTEEMCRCNDRPPQRPPKPIRLDLNLSRKPPMPPPPQVCTCSHAASSEENKNIRVGPYENYDVPKLASLEVDGEYYDTPKRLKECLNNELFKITKSASPDSVILKKPCGCLLKVGKRRKEPTVIDTDENIQPANCPCQRVTDWANNLIKLPYCKKNTVSSDNLVPNKENMKPKVDNYNVLYATIDVSRKTRRKTHPIEPDEFHKSLNSRTIEIDDGPLANYENLNFALSLEFYENAKDLLRKAGVTQAELNAISTNLRPTRLVDATDKERCAKCGHPPPPSRTGSARGDRTDSAALTSCDDYLMMEPKSLEGNRHDPCKSLPSGYTPMSPIGGFAYDTLKHPARSPIGRLLEEKSASNPTLCGPEGTRRSDATLGDPSDARPSRSSVERADRVEYRKRSSSADSSRFLEDVQEFEGGAGSRASSCETLREPTPDAAACRCAADGGSSEARAAPAPPGPPAGNRDSSSSNDSGVSSCSLRRAAEFELPATTATARRHYRRAAAAASPRGSLPRRSRSTDPSGDLSSLRRVRVPDKSSSAEAEVPVLSMKSLRGLMDTHSTSSGTSDMSDYIETLSICSSHSSSDTPITMRVVRQTTSTLRPRSGKEYQHVTPRHPPLYADLPP